MLNRHKKLLFTWLCVSLIAASGASALTGVVFQKKQKYTASVSLKFINSSAKDGYAFDGTEIKSDIQEILSADILTDGIRDAGLEGTVTADEIAPNIKIADVIPEDEQKKIDSALDNGKEYDYKTVEYKVTLVTPYPETGKILSGISDAYIRYFVNHHTGLTAMPENVPDTGSFDYIEAAEILDTYVKRMYDYLDGMAETMSDFRAENGYAYADLSAGYERIMTENIPELYAEILYNRASRDPGLLVQKLKEEQTSNVAENTDTSANVAALEDLIRSYSAKNKADDISGDYSAIDENRTNWLDNLHDNTSVPKSAYDGMFATYNSERDGMSFNDIESAYDDYLIAIYDGAEPTTDEAVISGITDMEDEIVDEVRKYYQAAHEMKAESDDVFASSCIRQLNTPMAERAVRIKLYMALMFVCMFMMAMVLLPAMHILRKKFRAFAASAGSGPQDPGMEEKP